LRGRGKINRVSIERLCAGPAVPLLYDYMRQKHPDLERVIEKEGLSFSHIDSHKIVEAAMIKKDPLCLKVIDKFAEIYGVEVGNMALSVLPYGGIYLIGGVTNGISEHLLHSDIFLDAFYQKGRQEKKLRKMPVFLVKKDV
jgi:glucokinase